MTVLSHARRLRATTVTVGFRALHATFTVATRSAVAIEFLERLYGAAEIGDCAALTGNVFAFDDNRRAGASLGGVRRRFAAGSRAIPGCCPLPPQARNLYADRRESD